MRSFLVGLGIGIGLGVLFAPLSGEQTRDNIKDRANDLADSAREKLEQGREQVRRLRHAVVSREGIDVDDVEVPAAGGERRKGDRPGRSIVPGAAK